MATAIVPKSEIRKDDSINHGYATLPPVKKGGRLGWALPGGDIIYCRDTAKEYAVALDTELAKLTKDTSQLLKKY